MREHVLGASIIYDPMYLPPCYVYRWLSMKYLQGGRWKGRQYHYVLSLNDSWKARRDFVLFYRINFLVGISWLWLKSIYRLAKKFIGFNFCILFESFSKKRWWNGNRTLYTEMKVQFKIAKNQKSKLGVNWFFFFFFRLLKPLLNTADIR